MKYELTFHLLDGKTERHVVEGVRTGEPPPIWLLMPLKLEPAFTRGGDDHLRVHHIGLVPGGEPRRFFKKTFRWARPASFDGNYLTPAFYAPDEVRYFEGRDSAEADDMAQMYIQRRLEGTAWPWT